MMQQPWRLPLLAWRLLACWSWLIVRAFGERRRRVDAVLVGYLGHFDVRLARRLFPRIPIVLDHLVSASGTARDRGLAGNCGVKAALMAAIDFGALSAADVVVVDTSQHLDRLPENVKDRAVVCPVGATEEWFAAGSAACARRPEDVLRVVFVGLFTPLHGTEILADALADLANDDRIEVSMVGRGQDHAEARRRAATNPRVKWIDWVAAEHLPAFVARHDVSLGIFGTTEKALDVVPTKVYQGAAAGCVVVTSDTPPQRAALGDAAVLVPPGDAQLLAAALRNLAANPALVSELRQAARKRASQLFTARGAVEPILRRLQKP